MILVYSCPHIVHNQLENLAGLRAVVKLNNDSHPLPYNPELSVYASFYQELTTFKDQE